MTRNRAKGGGFDGSRGALGRSETLFFITDPLRSPHQPYHYHYRIGINKYVQDSLFDWRAFAISVLKQMTEHWGRNLGCA